MRLITLSSVLAVVALVSTTASAQSKFCGVSWTDAASQPASLLCLTPSLPSNRLQLQQMEPAVEQMLPVALA